MDIRNIFCVGRNYARHAEELGNAVPKKPMIFTKPTHSLAKADEQHIRFPDNQGEIHYEIELVLYVGRDVVNEDFVVSDVVTHMALGIDFTLRDVQTELKQKGHPWLLAKGFQNAAVLTEFWPYPGEAQCKDVHFSLIKNDVTVQVGHIKDMIFSFQTLLTYIYQTFGLRSGDIIFTGTPAGVGSIENNDTFILNWGHEEKGRFIVEK
ncbi:fumarylacetoacetate hydrolase family protein [Lentibacillus saliphilus]|uniref:fumarylacetoacetate hydrolase family protein n=1 Tax=Lentibacillus saliphilus TaxID=2737028 RepID=UPI001C301FF2|nr:fumarylacetoacetate hydrolase family protein [Lentibacillus saliphilus]